MDSYLVPRGYGQAELVEKRSRFIGQVWRVETEEEARARIEEVRRRYHDARCPILTSGRRRILFSAIGRSACAWIGRMCLRRSFAHFCVPVLSAISGSCIR